jgi:mannosyltransferase
MNRNSRSIWSRSAWILSIIVLVGAALRLYRLDAQSFWADEAFSALIAASSAVDVLSNAFASVHPPGYYFLLHLWRSLAGGTDLALRYPSALLGVLGIVLTYQLGRNIRSRRLGLWAAGITALAPYHVFYSQEARMYTLLYCLTCVIMLAYIRLWQDEGYGWWVVFVLAAVAGLWSHFFAGFVIAVVGGHFCFIRLWHPDSGWPLPWRVSTGKASPGWLSFFVANGVIALVFGLYWARFLSRVQIVDAETWRVPPSLGELVGLPLALTMSQFLSGTWQMVAFGCVIFLVIIVGLQAARALWQRGPAANWLLLLALLFLIPVVTSYVVSYSWRLVFSARVLIIVAPALYLLIAWSAVHTRESRLNQLILFLLLPQAMLGLCHWFFSPSYAKPPVRDAAYLVQESKLANGPVLHAIPTSYKIFNHYVPDLDNRLITGHPTQLQSGDVYERMGGSLVDPTAVPGDHFWLVVFPVHSLEFQFAMRDDFDVRFHRQQEWDVSGIQIYYYAHGDS